MATEVNNSTVEIKTLAVYALKSHVQMTQEMMEWVALSSNEYLSNVKPVPASLVMDKTIKNGKLHYTNLLREQNYYLKQCEDFQIDGISANMLDRKV
eukprot:9173348-Ditylum_brightwellii.AAC.1